MQSTGNLNLNLGPLPPRRQEAGGVLDNLPRKKGHLWSWRSSAKGSVDETQPEAGTLPRGWSQVS